jgi:hypothetical protein
MPYIKRNDREIVDGTIDRTIAALVFGFPDIFNRPGPVNYVITRIVASSLKPPTGWSYHSISRAIAVLRDAATEMERRLMAHREKEAINENGDIEEYEGKF